MTAPYTPASETIRDSRAKVARDIARSRARITELGSAFRAETSQLANLLMIAEVVGVTDVATDRTPDVIDAGVEEAGKSEAPPAVGTPMGP